MLPLIFAPECSINSTIRPTGCALRWCPLKLLPVPGPAVKILDCDKTTNNDRRRPPAQRRYGRQGMCCDSTALDSVLRPAARKRSSGRGFRHETENELGCELRALPFGKIGVSFTLVQRQTLASKHQHSQGTHQLFQVLPDCVDHGVNWTNPLQNIAAALPSAFRVRPAVS